MYYFKIGETLGVSGYALGINQESAYVITYPNVKIVGILKNIS